MCIMNEELIAELKGYFETIRTIEKDITEDIQACNDYLIDLTTIQARANFLMAEYGKKLREEKKQAYLTLSVSSAAQEKYFAPSLARDYVNSLCHETAYIFDLSERLSRLITHTIDAMRTIISSLKLERGHATYQ